MFPRLGPYRNRKLLDVAHDAPCMFRIPGVCQSGVNPSVPCHSNQLIHGRGKDHKSHDCFAPAGCTACHYFLDFSGASREEKQDVFRTAQDRWILWLFQNGKISVNKNA